MSDNPLIVKTEKEYGPDYRLHILEQYKLYVEMADRVSARRMAANTFFVSLNTLILSAFGIISSLKAVNFNSKWLILVSVSGLLLTLTWCLVIRSYRQLNSGKFQVIHQIELLLPLAPYDAEWELIGKGRDVNKYIPITHIEQWVPVLFCLLYVGMLVASIITIF